MALGVDSYMFDIVATGIAAFIVDHGLARRGMMA